MIKTIIIFFHITFTELAHMGGLTITGTYKMILPRPWVFQMVRSDSTEQVQNKPPLSGNARETCTGGKTNKQNDKMTPNEFVTQCRFLCFLNIGLVSGAAFTFSSLYWWEKLNHWQILTVFMYHRGHALLWHDHGSVSNRFLKLSCAPRYFSTLTSFIKYPCRCGNVLSV